jgi:hypothetical protein
MQRSLTLYTLEEVHLWSQKFYNFFIFLLANTNSSCIFAHAITETKVTKLFRAISSAGSEHLVYTEGVGGSNPSSPTKTPLEIMEFFYAYYFRIGPNKIKLNRKVSRKYF